MNNLDRHKKRKQKLGTVSLDNIDENSLEKLQNSPIDCEKINSSYMLIEQNYEINYDLNVSQEEAREFLEQFQKDFNQDRFDKLIKDCQKNIITSIVTHFGLGRFVAVYDKVGGNVTTNYNFKKGITATIEDQDRYYEWKTAVNNNVDRTLHDEVKDKWKKDTYKSMSDGEIVTDGYTGKILGEKNNNRIDKEVSIHGEHITAVSQIQKDSRNHLFANGNTSQERLEDRSSLSGHKDNLTLIEGGMNSSKSDSDLKEWANSKVSKQHAKETGNPEMTNKEYYELNESLIDKEYKKSKNFIRNEQVKKQIKKQGKEIVSTGVTEGFKMGMQQAIGLIMTEFFTALFDEIIDIYNNGFYNNSISDEKILSVLKERCHRIGKRLLSRWKDVASAFQDGLISGFISNLITVFVNSMHTTFKRLNRLIREGIYSIFKAIKMVLYPPDNISTEEVLHEAKKIIASGIVISLGIISEEYVSKLIVATPILKPFEQTITSVFIGTITGLTVTYVVYYLDKNKNNKDAVNELLNQSDRQINEINLMLDSVK